MSVAAQNDVDLNLNQLTSFTDVYIGNCVMMAMEITFPNLQTTEGVVAEIILSLDEFNVAIGDITGCTTGTLTIGNTNFCTDYVRHLAPGYTAQDGVQHHHRAVFTLGTVTSPGSGDPANNKVVINFQAVLVSMGTLTVGDELIFSVGVLYDNGEKIWVAQTSFVAKGTQAGPGTIPTFDLILPGDSDISDEAEKQKVQLTFGLPNPQAQVSVEFASMNDTDCGLSVFDVNLVSSGSAYAYSLEPANIVADNYGQCCPNSISIDLGTLTNKESTKASPNPTEYNIVMEATVMATNGTIPDGETLTTAVAVYINGAEIWVAYIPGIKRDGTYATSPTYATAITGSSTVSAAMPCYMEVVVTTVPGTMTYTITVRTNLGTAAAARLSIVAVNPVSYGQNIACEISAEDMSVTRTDSDNDGIFEEYIVSVPISNYDIDAAVDSDKVTFNVFFLMSADAIEGETVTAIVNGDPSLEETFTVGPAGSYDNDVSYTFDLQQDCVNSFPVGSVVRFLLVVTTERNKIPGPSILEFPIPADIATSTLTFVSATAIDVGKNVGCVPFGRLDAELSYWDETQTEGPYDRARAYITLCNLEQVNDPAEDIIKIEFFVQIKNNAALNSAGSTTAVSFGLGWHYTGTHVWVVEYDVTTVASHDFGDGVIKYVKGITLNAGVQWPSDGKIEWSPDNVNFYSHNTGWEPYAHVSSTPTQMLSTSALITRFVRIVNTDGQCPVTPTYVTQDILTDIEFHGSTTLVKPFLQSMMFLLDGDNTTCLSLPTKAATTTTRFLYLSIKTMLPYLDTDGTSPFSISITGTGISCDTPFGPQVTKVSHRKDADALKFKGNRRKCSYTGGDVVGDKQSCRYFCDCTDATTCADVSLMILHHETVTGDYSLCDVTAIQ
ncbi:hypothetical protein ACF0H5_014632 [Mactra antiquata]